jgi:hypothetical protein
MGQSSSKVDHLLSTSILVVMLCKCRCRARSTTTWKLLHSRHFLSPLNAQHATPQSVCVDFFWSWVLIFNPHHYFCEPQQQQEGQCCSVLFQSNQPQQQWQQCSVLFQSNQSQQQWHQQWK